MIDRKFFDENHRPEKAPRGCRPLGPRPGMNDESRTGRPRMEDHPFPPMARPIFPCTPKDRMAGPCHGGTEEGRRFPHHFDPDSLIGLWIRSHRALERMPADHRGVKRVLRLLDLGGGSLTQRDLMQLMDVRPGSLSELLGKMEAHGLITRERREEDHRCVTITLTDAGREKAKERGRRDLFAALNEEEKEQLKAILAKLTASWENRPAKNETAGEDTAPDTDQENEEG